MKQDPFNTFQELSKDEILFRLKERDRWALEDIILFVHGYEHKGIDWDYILDGNTFPARQYNAALEAINDSNPKTQLKFVHKEALSSNFAICQVKKGTFIQWAKKRWDGEPRVEMVYNIWRYYKNQSGTTAPSLQTTKAKIKNYGDKVQIQEYIAHSKSKMPKPYKANISKIAKQAKLELNMGCKLSTYRKHIKRMTLEELSKHTRAAS